MSSETTTQITTKAIAKNPVLIEVIRDALAALEDNDGSSLQAIVRYVLGQYKVNTNANVTIKRSLKSIVKNSKLVQTKNTAVRTLFKLVSNLREKKKEARKPTKSPKKKTCRATKKAKSTPKKSKLLKPFTTPVSKLKLASTKIASKSKKAAAKNPAAKKTRANCSFQGYDNDAFLCDSTVNLLQFT